MNLVLSTVQNAAGTALHEGIFQKILQGLSRRFFIFAYYELVGAYSNPGKGTGLVAAFNVPIIFPQEEFPG